MTLTLGIVLALAAMLCWGFGDFFIQKSTRKFGDWETLFQSFQLKHPILP